MFLPIPGLISCTGMTERLGLPSHAQNAVVTFLQQYILLSLLGYLRIRCVTKQNVFLVRGWGLGTRLCLYHVAVLEPELVSPREDGHCPIPDVGYWQKHVVYSGVT